MAWIENGPVSLPTRPVITAVALAVGLAAVVGVGIGFRAGWRDGGHSSIGGIDSADDTAQAIPAKPLVDLPTVTPQQTTTAAPAANATADNDDDEDTNDIAEKTAAAQAVQSKPAQAGADIDDILTSSSEKPQAPAKPATDEDAPGSPVKGDVPF